MFDESWLAPQTADAAKFIRLLLTRCDEEHADHRWSECPRCLALFELDRGGGDSLGERLLAYAADTLLSQAEVIQQLHRATSWQPIGDWKEQPDEEAFWWVVPKTPEEAYCDTSGHSIFSASPPDLHRGKPGTWSSLSKATHRMSLPASPAPRPAPAPQENP